jgi:peroxin-12
MDPLSPLPSFLEMMMIEEATNSAQRGLKLALETAVERASRTARSPSPWRARLAQLLEYIGRAYGAELRLLVTYLVNRHCLRSSACASVAESLYGGRRAKLGAAKEGGLRSVLPLAEIDKTRLSLMLAVGPYIQERLEQLFQRFKQQSSSRPNCTTTWAKLRNLFVTVYPFLHMTKEGTIVAYQWMFLMGKTLFFHPLNHMSGQVVRRTTMADAPPSKDSTQPTVSIPAVDPLHKAVLLGLSSTLIMGWLHQFRSLLRAHEQHSDDRIPPPPSPLLVQFDPKTRLRPPLSNPTHCPLCRQPRLNPTVATSGYVFCHRCLVLFVREHAKCPLTGVKCPESRIMRIYEPSAPT